MACNSCADKIVNYADKKFAIPCDTCTGGFSITEASKSLLSVARDVVTGSNKQATEETIKARLDICKACDSLMPHDFMPPGNCKICGCFVFLKAKLQNQKCPAGKW